VVSTAARRIHQITAESRISVAAAGHPARTHRLYDPGMSATPVYGPPPGPPPRRTRWGLIIGLIAGGLVLLCCCGGGLFFGLIAVQTKPANAAAQSYVDAVIAHDNVTALKYVCSAAGSDAHHQDFTNYVVRNGVTAGDVVNTKVTLWNLSWKATVDMELTDGAGAKEPLTLPLAKEDGKWKVGD